MRGGTLAVEASALSATQVRLGTPSADRAWPWPAADMLGLDVAAQVFLGAVPGGSNGLAFPAGTDLNFWSGASPSTVARLSAAGGLTLTGGLQATGAVSCGRTLSVTAPVDATLSSAPAGKLRLLEPAAPGGDVAGLGLGGAASNVLTYHAPTGAAAAHVFYTGATSQAYGGEQLRVAPDGCTVSNTLTLQGPLVAQGAGLAGALVLGSNLVMVNPEAGSVGRLGLGTSAPGAQVEVLAPGEAQAAGVPQLSLVNSNTNGTAVAALRAPAAGDATLGLEGWTLSTHRADAQKLKLYALAYSAATFAPLPPGTTAPVLTVTREARVGMGTSNPRDSLEIADGSVRVSGNNARVTLESSTAAAPPSLALSNAAGSAVLNMDSLSVTRLTGSGPVVLQAWPTSNDVEILPAGTLRVRSNVNVPELNVSCNAAVRASLCVGAAAAPFDAVAVAGQTSGSLVLSAAAGALSLVPPSGTVAPTCNLRLDACGSNGRHAPAALALTPDGALGVGVSAPRERLHLGAGQPRGALIAPARCESGHLAALVRAGGRSRCSRPATASAPGRTPATVTNSCDAGARTTRRCTPWRWTCPRGATTPTPWRGAPGSRGPSGAPCSGWRPRADASKG